MSIRNLSYSIWSYSPLGVAYCINDAYGIKYTTTTKGGFKDCIFDVVRPLTREYDDLQLYSMIRVINSYATIVWEGMITNLAKKQNYIEITALGYSLFLASTQEINYVPGGAAQDISAYVSGNINSLISSGFLSNAYIANTGLNIVYSNGIATPTTKFGNMKAFLDKMWLYGDSNSRFFDYFVWQNRTFYWLPRPAKDVDGQPLSGPLTPSTPTEGKIGYYGFLQNASDSDLERSINSDYSSVSIIYTDSSTLYPTTITNSLPANLYPFATTFDAVFNGGAVVTPTANQITDITSYGPISASQAQYVLNTLLAQLSTNRITSTNISFTLDGSIYDCLGQNHVSLGSVRAGQIMTIPDFNSFDYSSQAYLNPLKTQNSFYIAETQYDVDNNQLDAKPEGQLDYSKMIERIITNMVSPTSYITLTGN